MLRTDLDGARELPSAELIALAADLVDRELERAGEGPASLQRAFTRLLRRRLSPELRKALLTYQVIVTRH